MYLVSEILSEEEYRCLQILQTLEIPSTRETIPCPAPGSCEWLLSHPKYLHWLHERRNEMLLITGGPGQGKSTLAKFLSDTLSSSAPFYSTTSAIKCFSFFFTWNGANRANTAASAVLSLVCQLVTCSPNLIHHVLPAYRDYGSDLALNFSVVWAIWQAASSDPTAPDALCIIDGLDECADSDTLVSALADLYERQLRLSRPNSIVKFLLTSRANSEVMRGSLDFPILRLSTMTEQDIRLFVQAGLADAFPDLPNRSAIASKVVERAQGNFLWASLVLTQIKDQKDLVNVQNPLYSVPSSLEEVYVRRLSEVLRKRGAADVLIAMSTAYRPLDIAEIEIVIACSDEDDEALREQSEGENTLCDLLTVLDGLVLVHNNIIRFIHQSFADFLRHAETIPGPTERNRQLARVCVSHLYSVLIKSKSYEPRVVVTEGHDGHMEDDPFLQYAAIYWMDHYREGRIEEGTELARMACELCDTTSDAFGTWFPLFWHHNRSIGKAPTGPCPEGLNRLILRSAFGHSEAVATLLRSLRDEVITFKTDSFGSGPLHWAAERGHEEVTRLLLSTDKCANDVRNNCGQTPLLLAVRNNNLAITALLLVRGADAGYQDENGSTVLMRPSYKGHEDMVKLLLEWDAPVNVCTLQRGRTALHDAATGGHYNVVHTLLDYGADVGATTREGLTPLMLAVMGDHVHVIELLTRRGADITIRDQEGRSALWYAAGRGNRTTIELLVTRRFFRIRIPMSSEDRGALIVQARDFLM